MLSTPAIVIATYTGILVVWATWRRATDRTVILIAVLGILATMFADACSRTGGT